MLLVTFHGGKTNKNPGRNNNVHAYDKDGNQVSAAVLDDPPGLVLDELRALCRHGNLLYVINANQEQNSVLCYQPAGKSFAFQDVFLSHQTCPGLVHPFDITFDDAEFCYISCQDTNLVLRIQVAKRASREHLPRSLRHSPATARFLPARSSPPALRGWWIAPRQLARPQPALVTPEPG